MLTAVDREVLVAILIGGDNTPGNIAELIERHPNSVQDRVNELEEQELVINKGSGVYALRLRGVTVARTVVQEGEIDHNTIGNWPDEMR